LYLAPSQQFHGEKKCPDEDIRVSTFICAQDIVPLLTWEKFDSVVKFTQLLGKDLNASEQIGALLSSEQLSEKIYEILNKHLHALPGIVYPMKQTYDGATHVGKILQLDYIESEGHFACFPLNVVEAQCFPLYTGSGALVQHEIKSYHEATSKLET